MSGTGLTGTGLTGTGLTDATVTDRLLEVLAGHLRTVPPDVDWATAALPDLGLDSMSAIELVLAIEDEFGAQFPEDLLVRETFATFGSLAAVVREMASRP